MEPAAAAPVISIAPTSVSQPTVTASQQATRHDVGRQVRKEVGRDLARERDSLPMSERATRTSMAMRRAQTSRPPRRADWRTLLLAALGIGVVAAGVTVAAISLLRPPPVPPSASRFIVVESPDKAGAAPAAPAPGPAVVTASAGATATAPISVEPSSNPARRPEPSGAAALTRHFAQREGALQRCFERYAAALSGQPEISVDFDVAPSGKVQSAALKPPSLAPTPLGQCLIDVARGTSFGAVGKALRFSIPIRARSVNR
jgi:hypothetical protein